MLDFELIVDFIGLARGLSFDNLDIVQRGTNTAIQFADETLARVIGAVADELNAGQFVPA
ncbi:MAG: hypothetical protein AAFQ63_12455 [Cyanobacteria bacterium J06621_11]